MKITSKYIDFLKKGPTVQKVRAWNKIQNSLIQNFFFYFETIFQYKSRDSSVGIALGYGLDGVLGFDSRGGLGSFLITVSRTALGPTQLPMQWVPGALSLGVKRPGREADHSPPSSAEVKNVWSYTSTLPIRLHGVVLS
jgi:hypothetical protein